MTPSSLIIYEIWFRESLALHWRWKKEVFLSLALSHMLRDFNLRCSSSSLNDWVVRNWASLSSAIWEREISQFSILIWIAANSSTWSFLLSEGEGRGTLSHFFSAFLVCINFCSQTKLGEPWTNWFQAWLTVAINPSHSIQSGQKRKGIRPRSSSFSKNRAMGWWSEESLGRILEEII